MAPFFKTPPLSGHIESLIPKVHGANQILQVLSGPIIMAIMAVLQMQWKSISGSNTPHELYTHIWKALGKSEFRDKVGRFVQYGCRFLSGCMAHMDPAHSIQAIKPQLAELQTTLAWARRTHRWGKEMPHIPTLAKSLDTGDWLQSIQSANLITFLVQDHIYFLLKVGIIKSSIYAAAPWHRRNLRFITMNHVIAFIICQREIGRIKGKQASGDKKYAGDDGVAKADKDVYDNRRQMFRYVLTFFQMSSVSGMYAIDDMYVGFMGIISSYLDASKQW